jgi:hypothetical protein
MQLKRFASSGRAGLVTASLLGLASLFSAPATALASPCYGDSYCSSDPDAYHLQFTVSATAPLAITDIFDFYWSTRFNRQGDFSLATPPSLPTGSGTLDAGIWLGEDEHFLAGITVDGSGNDHLVIMVNTATATLMAGRAFDDMVNGIPPLAQPNPYPITGAEIEIIDRLKNTPPEFNNDIWSFFDPLYRPNRLNPAVLVSGSSGTTTLTMLQFSTGTIIGTVDVEVAPVAPVPEPASWLSLAAGIAVLGLAVLRPGRGSARERRLDGAPRV